jgi:hypothetical protein
MIPYDAWPSFFGNSPSIKSDLPWPFESSFIMHLVPVIVVQIFNSLQNGQWRKRNFALVPTENMHSWGHCHNPSHQKLLLVTSVPCEMHFTDIVPLSEVQGLVIPTEMDRENKIDTIPEENLHSGGHWHNISPKLWWLVTPKGLDWARINKSWSSINFEPTSLSW